MDMWNPLKSLYDLWKRTVQIEGKLSRLAEVSREVAEQYDRDRDNRSELGEQLRKTVDRIEQLEKSTDDFNGKLDALSERIHTHALEELERQGANEKRLNELINQLKSEMASIHQYVLGNMKDQLDERDLRLTKESDRQRVQLDRIRQSLDQLKGFIQVMSIRNTSNAKELTIVNDGDGRDIAQPQLPESES